MAANGDRGEVRRLGFVICERRKYREYIYMCVGIGDANLCLLCFNRIPIVCLDAFESPVISCRKLFLGL